MPINESIKENYLVHKNPMPLGVGVSVLLYHVLISDFSLLPWYDWICSYLVNVTQLYYVTLDLF